jgi:CheY-like chemotaxis protein
MAAEKLARPALAGSADFAPEGRAAVDKRCRRTILIVEDDPDAVEANRILLEGEGYHTISATDPCSALERMRSERPDLILLDVMMPSGTEGFHFVWNLRRDPDPCCRAIPIIVLSAIHRTTPLRFYPDQSDGYYQPYEYLPVEALLDKPASSERLLAEIAAALRSDKRRPSAGLRGGDSASLGSTRLIGAGNRVTD